MNKYFTQHALEALQNLWIFKLRSLLTLLGVMVGTASVVALISSGQLATAHALEQFKTLGTDLFAVSIEEVGNTQASPVKLELPQVEKIKHASQDILIAAPYVTDYAAMAYGSTHLSGGLIGITQPLSKVVKIEVSHGRFISDWDKAQYVCVIGASIADSISDGNPENLIGKQIRVGNHFVTIVGITKPWMENMFLYTDINRSVMLPIGTELALNKNARIQNILFKLNQGADIQKVQDAIESAIHTMLPTAKLFFRSGRELLNSMEKQHQTFTLMLGAIGCISLLVGGIGVMNIMLVSVVERRREIGIRIAIGAKQRDILWMFLIEAIILTLCGGVMGILVGVFISWIIALFSHWAFSILPLPLFFGFFVSVLVGIFFGYYPAYKASELDPIETLRAE